MPRPSLLSSNVDLNNKRQSGHEMLNARLAVFKLPPRPARSVPRPRGEAGRKSATSNGGHRDGFTLKETLKCESNVDPEHFAKIQVFVISTTIYHGLMAYYRTQCIG